MDAQLYSASPSLVNPCATRPLLLGIRSSKIFTLLVIAIAVFTDTFFYTLIIPILPDLLEKRSGIPPHEVQPWISALLSMYAVANLVTSPVAGLLTDWSRSRKPALLGGLLAMGLSTAMFMFGRAPVILLLARASQGASAAIVRVTGLALITDTFGAGNSGAAIGWQSVGMFVGTFTGPAISGILYDKHGHMAVFIAACCVLGLDLFLRLVLIEQNQAIQWQEPRNARTGDESSALIAQPQDSLLEAGLTRHSQSSSAGEGNVCSQSTDAPLSNPSMLLFQLLKSCRMLSSMWATFSCAVIMTALESVIPLYVMELFSWTPTQTGLLIIALSISIISDPLLGSLADRYGSRWFSVCGFLGITTVYAAATTVVHDEKTDKIVLCALLILMGFTIGAVQTPNMVEVSLLVKAKERNDELHSLRAEQVMGQAYALLNVSYQLGSLVGPIWGGAAMASQGWEVMCLSFATLAGASTGILFFFAGE